MPLLYIGCDCAVSHVSREMALEVKKNISRKDNGVSREKATILKALFWFFHRRGGY